MEQEEIERRTRDWVRRQGLQLARGPQCPRRLHGARHVPVGCDCLKAWADHGLLLERDGLLVAFASEPYGLGPHEMADLVAYVTQKDLDLVVERGAIRDRTVLVSLSSKAR